MKKYKITGVTKYALKHLTQDDFNSLFEMIGDIITEDGCKQLNNKRLFIMSDGEFCHEDFLQLEEIN